ncbi:MAG: polysaccharide deacetylase family protein [Cyclobacteriaceae bacterium]
MFFYRIPKIITRIYPDYVWNMDRNHHKIYLTFDDGPVPEVTDFVLAQLMQYHMRATFFMVGENIHKHPGLAFQVASADHGIGNHTQNHLKGSASSLEDYLGNIRKCQETIQSVLNISPKLFRPPYGSLTLSQKKDIMGQYKIIFWDLLSGDFITKLSPKKSLYQLKQKTTNGSIILFHDQLKTFSILKAILPEYLKFIDGEGYQTAVL